MDDGTTRARRDDGRHCAMTKFDGLAKADRKRSSALTHALDDVYDLPSDGVVALEDGSLARERASEAEDWRKVARATNASDVPRAFFDVKHDDWDEPQAIVIEFARHEGDATSNAASALDWFETRCEGADDGASYASAEVRLGKFGKELTISGPMAFTALKKKRTTVIGAAASRDVWCDPKRGTLFANLALVPSESFAVPESALYLGKVSEKSHFRLLRLIPKSLDHFQGGANVVPRVGLCGRLMDACKSIDEDVVVEENRMRVSSAREALERKRETEESTKKRLQSESAKVGRDVRQAVAYAEDRSAKKRQTNTKSTAAWDTLGADASASDSDE